jgi:hypothetical protein
LLFLFNSTYQRLMCMIPFRVYFCISGEVEIINMVSHITYAY